MKRIIVDLSPRGNSIYIRMPGFDPRLNDNIKAFLPKPTIWLPSQEAWKTPLLWESCTGIRKVANMSGYKIKIGRELRVWAIAEKVRLASIPDPNNKEIQDSEFTGILESDFPVMWKALEERPFQKVGVRYVATTRAALIADQPGLGKTLQTIAGIVEAGVTGPVLIVAAPKSAATLTWPDELARWVPGEPVVSLGADQKFPDRIMTVERIKLIQDFPEQERVWVVTSPEYVRMKAEIDKYGNYVKKKGRKVLVPGAYALTGLFDISWSAVVADESHKTLAVATQNRKRWSAQRTGMELVTLKGDPLKVALSGTPFRGKEENAFGTAHWLLPKQHTSFWRWAEKHFVVYSDPAGFGGSELGELKDEDLFYDWARTFMIRRTKEEVAKDLLPKLYGGTPLEPDDEDSPVAVWLPMRGQQLKQYTRVAEDAVIEFSDGTSMLVNGTFPENTRFRQLACSAGKSVDGTFYPTLPSNKFDWCADFLKDRGLDSDTKDREFRKIRKIIIASQFTKLINMFHNELEKLGVATHVLTGATSSKKRRLIQKDWQTNKNSKVRVLLGNTQAMGASITLDAMCDDIINLDETWMKDDAEQLEDRIHRLSNTDHSVIVWNLRSLGSYEEGLSRRAMARENSIKGSIDGARGVEFKRLILPNTSANRAT